MRKEKLCKPVNLLNTLPFNGEVYLYTDFFTPLESEFYFEALLHVTPWKHEHIKILGKETLQPKLTAWYGDNILHASAFSEQTEPWNNYLIAIKQRVEDFTNIKFSHALLNLYRNGKDHVNWHRNNEKTLGINPAIALITFGATRVFEFRHYNNLKNKISIELPNGSLLLMLGETQYYWEHQVPAVKKSAPRISISFRAGN